jgi:hypothetical protein
MRRLVWLLGIMLLGQVTGCAILRTSTDNVDAQIDSLLLQRDYGKALALVAHLKESPSASVATLQASQKKINIHIAAYERQVTAEAEKAVAANDWGAAFDSYRAGLSRLPESAVLRQGQQQLLQRHAEHLDALELERLIAKGEWTLKDLELSKLAGANNSGDWFRQFALNRKMASANDVALELADQGKRALTRQDLGAANRLLSLATNLSNAIERKAVSPQLQETLREEELRLRNEQHRTAVTSLGAQRMGADQHSEAEPPAIKGQEQKTAKRLMADFRKACREKNLVEAQQLRSQLEELGVDNQEFQKLSKQLASDVARQVKHLTERGATHYSRQQYEDAMNVWKQAQALDPNNEQLNARIKRVTRVLDKLQALREKNGVAQ